jgi:hypothetical protein
MKKIDWNTITIDVFAILGASLVGMMILFGAGCFKPEAEVKYVEVIQEQAFDTSIIEQAWCGGFEDGTVRMVGAWWYADGVVEDEQGQLWGIDQEVSMEDFLLLWIADNNTPNNTTDDVVIKVWREAY